MSTEENSLTSSTNKRIKLDDDGAPVPTNVPVIVNVSEQANANENAREEIPVNVNSGVTPVSKIVDNIWLIEEGKEKLDNVRKCWDDGTGSESLAADNLSIGQIPFRHAELKNFIQNPDFVRAFRELFTKIEFHEKASDLFQFSQSDDLNSVVDPHVYAINEYLVMKVLPFLKKITNLPLNDTVDMFLSTYVQTDFLLCHDDELDSRRIAFIWYISEEWSQEYGGTLDLFSATDDFQPREIVKKILPEFNKFVFFEVGATSFHQVSEVLKNDAKRLALSGWFYGEPVARPKIELPVEQSFKLLSSFQNHEGILSKFCADMYLSPETFSEINEQLSEESEVLVPGFLRDDVYASVCKSIVEMDVTNSVFSKIGPPNVSCYEEAFTGPPENTSDESSTPSFKLLQQFFYSTEFLNFMEKITEFPFTTCPITKVVSSLQKYSHGSYRLLKLGGAKQTGFSTGVPEQDVNEDEEEPNFVDVMFFIANKWNEGRGGVIIYTTTDGEQLITVPPEGNCLAVVVRSSTVNSYTNYVNSLAKDDVFFVYRMTFAFDGSI